MRRHVHARVFALIAALTLAGADQAAAESLSLSNSSFRVTWSSLSFEAGVSPVRCPITLEGSFHSGTLLKVAGTLIGNVTRAAAGTCTSGTVTVLTETLPWHVKYASFAGALPNITTVNVSTVGAAFSGREPVFGVTCLFRSTAEAPSTLAVTREAGGALTTASAGGTIPENGCGLGVSARLSGSGTVTLLGAATRISLTLIREPLGELSIAPDPIDLTAEVIREVVLTNPGPGLTTINTIVPETMVRDDFRVEDNNLCQGSRVFPNDNPRACRFILRRLNPGRTGQITIRFRRRFGASEVSKSVTARS